MKNCPTCKRTYEDNTLVFCLDDGTRLSAPYDPHATLLGNRARDTEPPRTAILPSELTPARLAYRQEALRSQLTERRGSKLWIILSGLLALIVVGLMIVLGFLAWQANNKSTPEPSRGNSDAQTNSNVPANANRNIESKPTDNVSSQWLDGVWEGEGYQSDTKTTWAVRLTVLDGTYTIEYPNIPCRGRWSLLSQNSGGASFTEVITQGAGCANNSHVMLEKVNDSEISCRYTYAHSRVVIATAVLSKKAHSIEQR